MVGFTWPVHGPTGLSAKGCAKPGNPDSGPQAKQGPIPDPRFSWARPCFVKEDTADTGQAGSTLFLGSSVQRDQGKGGSPPAEGRRPHPRSQIFHQGSIEGLCPLTPATQRQLPWSGHLILSPRFLMANINCGLQQDHLQCVSH